MDAEQQAYLEKLRSLQLCLRPQGGAFRYRDKIAKDFFTPPKSGVNSLGILIPSGGRLTNEHMDELIGATLEKTAKDKRFHSDEPQRTIPIQFEVKGDRILMEGDE